MTEYAAKWIWSDPTGEGYNRWVLFRREFDLPAGPWSGRLCIFADTRYRLLVNGQVVCHGPARFYAARPEYDTVDIAPYLQAGPNAVGLIVNSYGRVSFHSETSLGGLIVWGDVEDESGNVVPIASDEAWRALASPAHRSDTPVLSFALNPGEHLDARHLPPGWDRPGFDDGAWPAAAVHGRPDHWGRLLPRSIPLLDEREVLPRRRIGTWAARAIPGEEVHSLIVTTPGGAELRPDGQACVLTWIHSPRPQKVTLGAWWGRHWLNGRELAPVRRDDLPRRQDFPAELNEGWNCLLVREAVRNGWWDFYLALPAQAGLSLSAERQVGSPHTFLLAGPWEDELAAAADRLPWPLADPDDLPAELGPWRPWPRGRSAEAPCHERAWKTFEKLSDEASVEVDVPALAEAVGDDTLSLLFDFDGEVLGRPVLDFTAAAGTVVDVTYNERLCPDGTADVHYRHFVDMAERYVARDGRQTWQTFHPRGFRYLEVLVRGDLSRFELHRLAATRASYPAEDVGRFECSDPVLNGVWELGRAALHACMEDVYLDCPHRERGLYSGDFLVQFFGNLAAFGDTRLFRRCIEIFLLGQGADGMIRPGAHGLAPGRHPDYTAVLPQAMWEYWVRTGDEAFLREYLPHLRKLAGGLDELRGGEVLLDATGMHPYVDLCRVDREGASCAVNCFVQRGFFDAARLFEVLGEADDARAYFAKADDLAAAIREAFWDERLGAFTDRRRADVPDTEASVPANALALLYDIASDDQAPRAMEWLVDAMAHNFRVPDPAENRDCNVTSYFSFYALGALYGGGRAVEAERFMRTCWGRMLDAGAWTTWEYFVDPRGASRCHAWSCSPTHYLSSRVLGVTFPEPGNPDVVAVWPQPGTLQWAAGVYPHPAGPIHVRWEVRNGTVLLECEAPEGVEIITAPPA